jgi:aldose 1-epimerase
MQKQALDSLNRTINMTHPLFTSMVETPAYDGEFANLVLLKNRQGCSVVLMDIGATWLSCELTMANQQKRELLLSVSTMTDFQQHSAYLGATVGRYANRIAKGQFEIDGIAYQVSQSQGENCLHGGLFGFDKRRWVIEDRSDHHVCFAIHSLDGDQGFPGNLNATVTYTLTDDNQVKIEYFAQTDKACPVNMTNHAYFNLQDAESGVSCLDHWLKIDSDFYLPTTSDGIPLGELATVQDSGFDFREWKTINQDLLLDPQQTDVKGYDHSYWLKENRSFEQPVAEVLSADKLVHMKVFTDKPALQFYSGNWLSGTPSRTGSEYNSYAGFALETQLLPDSPNHTEWDQVSSILRPGDTYRSTTTYQFTCQL